jgi:hypothetical protein
MATTSFADLKRSRSELTNSLTQELDKFNTKSSYTEDENKYWELQVDKAGNGSALIRFLASPENESSPFIRYWEHGFQGPPKGDQKGMWYIEKSLSTLGQDDPCGEYNTKLWETGLKTNEEIVRKQKRKLHYVSNIYIIKDPANPDNEGKVFLYKYGKKIFDKINDVIKPAFDDDAINPFDLWDGANFKLRAMKVDGYRNYDKSEFDKTPSPLVNDDDELEKIWKSEYSLAEVIAPSKFKSYDELKNRLDKVLRINTSDSIIDGGKVPVKNKLAKTNNPTWVDPDEEVLSNNKNVAPWDEDDNDSEDFFKKFKQEE